MQISVSGQNIDVGNALKQHVESELQARVLKYFEHAIEATVVFGKENHHLFTASIHVNDGTGNTSLVNARGKAPEAYAAFDQAAEKIEKQLRRYKRRLKSHTDQVRLSKADPFYDAKKFVLSQTGEEVAEEDNPLIIAEKQLTIETLTVSDAVMRMNLAHLPALMFINKKTGSVNIVYHREDGNISWVDSNIFTNLHQSAAA